jgi:hypothetical protein
MPAHRHQSAGGMGNRRSPESPSPLGSRRAHVQLHSQGWRVNRGDYRIRWWIPAEQPPPPRHLVALARQLSIPEQVQKRDTAAALLAELGRRDNWPPVSTTPKTPQVRRAGALPTSSPEAGRTRPGRNRGGVLPWDCGSRPHLWMVMVSLSVSFPQTEKFCVQPEMSAVATAVPCLKVFPPLVAWTRTRIC